MRTITYEGETKTVAEWAAIVNISENTLRSRLRRGWSAKDTLTKPKIEDRAQRGRIAAKRSPWRYEVNSRQF